MTTTHFGFTDIPFGEKQDRVNAVFDAVASRYDLMNDVMSGGLHRLWKNDFIDALHPITRPPLAYLDVAGGTGDIAFRLHKRVLGKGRITVLDINAEMLEVGRTRAAEQGFNDITFVEGDAQALPFEDSIFDRYSIAFGIRNVPDVQKALNEAFRVLKSGGRFGCLEFSHVTPFLKTLYDTYSFHVIPPIGRLVTGASEPYQYLVESIRRFPSAPDFAEMLWSAGFRHVDYDTRTQGVVAIHAGIKE
jgi:demethylmenaquinone methyltransferase / 2-methoxy-6-polyprenyl-1,4-benzoquinol methylase